MASSPRPDMAPRKQSALRPWLWLVGAIAIVVLVGWLSRGLYDTPPTANAGLSDDYVTVAESRQLQIEIDHLDADDDWRARADLPETDDSTNSRFPWLAAITFAQVIVWLLVASAVAVLVFMVYLAVRHGAGLRVDMRKSADPGTSGSGSRTTTRTEDLPELTLEEIAALADAAKALGALQRLVLVAAAEATGSVLRRSETAREALRRLPRDWRYFDQVARLVQTAERVRYAGQPIEREGVDSLIADARQVLARQGASG